MKFKLNQKVKTPKGEGVIIHVDNDSLYPYRVQFSNMEREWFKEFDLELIPQTLQERWDSGERFRGKRTKAEVKELHVFESGIVAVTYEDGLLVTFKNEEDFFEQFEPIPSEPETRWVNVYIEGSECINVVDETKRERATFSVQQQLINGKWVNV